MTKIFVVGPKQLRIIKLGAAAVLLAGAALLYWERDRIYTAGAKETSKQTAAAPSAAPAAARTINLVTGEFKTTGPDGKTIEAYRWDPGTIYVKRGENVKLSIFGVNGASHPFVIEGLNIKGEVKKGQETVVSFRADRPGVYRIVCMTHPDIAHNGPMVGYLVVDE